MRAALPRHLLRSPAASSAPAARFAAAGRLRVAEGTAAGTVSAAHSGSQAAAAAPLLLRASAHTMAHPQQQRRAAALPAQEQQQQHMQRRGLTMSGGPPGDEDVDASVLGKRLEVEPMPFNSVLLDTDNMRVTDTSDFTTRLLVTLQKLREEGKSSMWVRVHALNGHLLGVLGTFGFRMHHCEPTYVMLNQWLQPKTENKIPPYATHLVGVAGFVLNRRREVLLVKEGSKQVSGWKLPGGYTNLGEEFGAAACREVEEETGVRCEFGSILAVRHQHNVSFGRSDIYVVTRLKALTEELRPCPHEIQDARWVPLDQFRREASHPILKTVAELTQGLDAQKEDDAADCLGDIVETEHPSILPNRPPYKLYHRAIPK